MNKFVSVKEAADKIKDGMTVMVGGFLGVGNPIALIDALVEKGVKDLTIICMNVDDFDEGYELLKRHGFRNALGEGQFVETPFLKGAHMVSPSGFAIMLMKHIKR